MSIVLRSRPSESRAILAQVVAYGLFFLGWWLVTAVFGFFKPGIVPSPVKVVTAFLVLPLSGAFWSSLGFSLSITLLSCLEAVCITIPLGLFIGLHPYGRAIFEKPLAALRFLPLTALIGIFLTWFGIKMNMKVQFLSLCTLVYLLPAFVGRVDEVKQVHLDTIKTLGASNWQTIKKVFLPATFAPFFTDMRVLFPIGWTYIILVETVNLGDGGIGQMIFSSSRMSQIDFSFALLLYIVLVAFSEDKTFMLIDRWKFPFKYAGGER